MAEENRKRNWFITYNASTVLDENILKSEGLDVDELVCSRDSAYSYLYFHLGTKVRKTTIETVMSAAKDKYGVHINEIFGYDAVSSSENIHSHVGFWTLMKHGKDKHVNFRFWSEGRLDARKGYLSLKRMAAADLASSVGDEAASVVDESGVTEAITDPESKGAELSSSAVDIARLTVALAGKEAEGAQKDEKIKNLTEKVGQLEADGEVKDDRIAKLMCTNPNLGVKVLLAGAEETKKRFRNEKEALEKKQKTMTENLDKERALVTSMTQQVRDADKKQRDSEDRIRRDHAKVVEEMVAKNADNAAKVRHFEFEGSDQGLLAMRRTLDSAQDSLRVANAEIRQLKTSGALRTEVVEPDEVFKKLREAAVDMGLLRDRAEGGVDLKTQLLDAVASVLKGSTKDPTNQARPVVEPLWKVYCVAMGKVDVAASKATTKMLAREEARSRKRGKTAELMTAD